MSPSCFRIECKGARSFGVHWSICLQIQKCLHQLDKLGEKIIKASPTYVTLQFISKLQLYIALHIVLHADQIIHLDKAIEAARRIGQSFTAPTFKLPTSNSPGSASADWKPERSALLTSRTRYNSRQGHLQQRQNFCKTCGSKSDISCHCTKPTRPHSKKTPDVWKVHLC